MTPKTYTAPRFHPTRGTDLIKSKTATLEEVAQRIAQDQNLSARGKLVTFTKTAAPVYRELRGIRAALKRKLDAKVEAARNIMQSAQRKPDAVALELGRDFETEMKRDPAFRKRALDRLLDASDTSDNTNRLRAYFLDRDPMLTGLSEPSLDLIRYRLAPSLPQEVRDAEREFSDLQAQMADVQVAMESVLQACDRATLEEDGVVGKPMINWSAEERAAYIEQHGLDSFRSDLAADLRLIREPAALPETQAPHGHADALEKEMAAAEALFAAQQNAA